MLVVVWQAKTILSRACRPEPCLLQQQGNEMSDEITIPIAAIGGTGGLLSIIGGYLLRSHNERIKRIEQGNESNAKTASDLAIELANYKLDSEKRFAKDANVQASFSRLHDR